MMPSTKIVRARRTGWCDQEFAHPGTINPGDRVRVTTYFPSDEVVREFGMPPFTRSRTCTWCVEAGEERAALLADYAIRTARPLLLVTRSDHDVPGVPANTLRRRRVFAPTRTERSRADVVTWRECRARNGDVQCQRVYQHEGPHRAETGEPKPDERGTLQAQVLTWD